MKAKGLDSAGTGAVPGVIALEGTVIGAEHFRQLAFDPGAIFFVFKTAVQEGQEMLILKYLLLADVDFNQFYAQDLRIAIKQIGALVF